MTLTGAQKRTVLRALKLAIDYREIDTRSNQEPSGNVLVDGRDVTKLYERDLSEFRALQRRMRG